MLSRSEQISILKFHRNERSNDLINCSIETGNNLPNFWYRNKLWNFQLGNQNASDDARGKFHQKLTEFSQELRRINLKRAVFNFLPTNFYGVAGATNSTKTFSRRSHSYARFRLWKKAETMLSISLLLKFPVTQFVIE